MKIKFEKHRTFKLKQKFDREKKNIRCIVNRIHAPVHLSTNTCVRAVCHRCTEKVLFFFTSMKNLHKFFNYKGLDFYFSMKFHSSAIYVFSQVRLKLSSILEKKSYKKNCVLIILVNWPVLCKNFMPWCASILGTLIILYKK